MSLATLASRHSARMGLGWGRHGLGPGCPGAPSQLKQGMIALAGLLGSRVSRPGAGLRGACRNAAPDPRPLHACSRVRTCMLSCMFASTLTH